MVFLGVDQRHPAKEHQEALAAAAPAVAVSCDREPRGIWCIPSAQDRKFALWLSGQYALAHTEM